MSEAPLFSLDSGQDFLHEPVGVAAQTTLHCGQTPRLRRKGGRERAFFLDTTPCRMTEAPCWMTRVT